MVILPIAKVLQFLGVYFGVAAVLLFILGLWVSDGMAGDLCHSVTMDPLTLTRAYFSVLKV